MKRAVYIGAIFLMILCISGCGSTTVDSTVNSSDDISESNTTIVNNNVDERESSVSSYSAPKNYCDASGCLNEGNHKIIGISGNYEYYCDEHYDEMDEIMDNMEEEVAHSTESKHICEVSGCEKEGIYQIEGFSGVTEYYCTEHYNEMVEILNMMMGD